MELTRVDVVAILLTRAHLDAAATPWSPATATWPARPSPRSSTGP
ncbi:hypothetical protein [Saccharothrix xinjiangensis]|uniref:Uncharacterized protein n=1 Tax=Saccharothrix xinjiangensis TaxID=204798 RepID=A0ABV9Y3Q2_9PSEU